MPLCMALTADHQVLGQAKCPLLLVGFTHTLLVVQCDYTSGGQLQPCAANIRQEEYVPELVAEVGKRWKCSQQTTHGVMRPGINVGLPRSPPGSAAEMMHAPRCCNLRVQLGEANSL